MRKLLTILFSVGVLSGCLSTHNTDGKHRPDEKQHTAFVASYSKWAKAVKVDERRPCRDELEAEADDAWACRDLSWGDYQRRVMKEYYWESAEVVPVKTSTATKAPAPSKPKGKLY